MIFHPINIMNHDCNNYLILSLINNFKILRRDATRFVIAKHDFHCDCSIRLTPDIPYDKQQQQQQQQQQQHQQQHQHRNHQQQQEITDFSRFEKKVRDCSNPKKQSTTEEDEHHVRE